MPIKTSRRSLGEVLLEQGLITQEQLTECLAIQRATRQSLVNVLLEKNYIDEEKLVLTFVEQLDIPHIRVSRCHITKEVLQMVPENLARQHQMLPVSVQSVTNNGVSSGVLTLAMADPQNLRAFDDLRLLKGLTNYEIKPVVAFASELKEAIERYYRPEIPEEEEKPMEAESVETVEEKQDLEEELSGAVAGAAEAPIIQLVNRILLRAIDMGASDIHIEPFEKHLRVRYRVDGALEELRPIAKKDQQAVTCRLKIMSNLDISERRVPQDGRFRVRCRGHDIDFRISFLPCYYGEKIVMRILDKSALTLDLDALGFEPQPMAAFKDALKLPFGMILLTGPTGSGKTTTLYSALHKLNEIHRNIITIEDPVEYELFGVNQVQVNPEVGLTFAAGLRSILRQDPDVIMVGEIRDEETADIAVKAALTGHLVLSTLHTNDAASVFTRLIDMGLEPFLVQSSVALAAAQRLARRICPECKQPVRVPQEVLDRIQFRQPEGAPPPQFARGRGCQRCNNTGYKGRLAVIEAMPNYPELQDLVMRRAPAAEIKRVAMKCGMATLRQNALAKAAAGLTTIEEVLRISPAD